MTAFDAPPRYADVRDPVANSGHEQVVAVLAAGLHPRVRSQADGSHYTSTDELPLVPGIDGVGRDASGTLRYFVLPDTRWGAMAERAVIDTRRSIVLPAGVDPVRLAAAMNPAMSSWVALRRRIDVPAGRTVMILGATGNAGRMAIQVAARLGAAEIVAVGRDGEALAATTSLGATATVVLDGTPEGAAALAAAGRDVDVVLDYLWGAPAAEALGAIVPARQDDAQDLCWVQIGSVAGATAAIPAAALRATRLQIVGSGQGSVSGSDILAVLPELVEEIAAGTFRVDATAVPLSEVEEAWGRRATGSRVVLAP